MVWRILRQILSNLNVDAQLYDTHSLRIGRTSDLFKAGWSIEKIKIFGRWKSNAVYRYVSLRLRMQNGISRLISALCINCLISIPEYSRICLHVQNGISRLISTLCVNCLISILEYSRLNHLDVHLV